VIKKASGLHGNSRGKGGGKMGLNGGKEVGDWLGSR
jgi:hypothetical protein